MPPESKPSRIAKPSKTGRNAEVQIEQMANGGVVVRKEYPDVRRRKDLKIIAIVCPILCLIPVVIWILFGKTPGGQIVTLFSIVVVISILGNIAIGFTAGTSAWVLRADQTGLTVDLTTWRRHTIDHFTRGQIDDIILDCSGGTDPHSSTFKSFLLIKPSGSRSIRCLHDVGGDHLARVANALRAALRMPARTWPWGVGSTKRPRHELQWRASEGCSNTAIAIPAARHAY